MDYKDSDANKSFSSSEQQFLFLLKRGLEADLSTSLSDCERKDLLVGGLSVKWDDVMILAAEQVVMGIINRAICTLPNVKSICGFEEEIKKLGIYDFTRDLVGALSVFLPHGDWMIVPPDKKKRSKIAGRNAPRWQFR